MPFLSARPALIMTVGAAAGLAACTAPAPEADGVIVRQSRHSVSETLDRIEAEAASRGARVFARLDHAAAARTTGVEMDDAGLVIFGNPALGTPLIAESRTAGLDLPVRMLVWEADGDVWLAWTDPAAIAERHGLNPGSEAVRQLSDALNGFAEEVTAEDEG